MALITAEHLTKSYPRTGPGESGLSTVVHDVSFTLERGATLGLVGESGSGKSTIARMVLGLIPPTSGQVLFDGVPLHTLGGRRMRALRRLSNAASRAERLRSYVLAMSRRSQFNPCPL